MRKGFTLVELSIVLVVVGLLVGGILIAKSMTDTTRVHSFLRQITQADIAMSNFITMYGALPGDYRGNRNGIIEDDGVGKGPGYVVAINGEAENYWIDLNSTGFDPQRKYTSTITGNYNSNKAAPNAPITAFDANSSIIPSSWEEDGIFNWYRIANISEVTNANRSIYPNDPALGNGNYMGDLNAVKSADVQAIASKIGDGSMAEGPTISYIGEGKIVFGIHYPDWQNGCTLANDKCNIYIRMLSQVGQKTR